MQQWRRARKGWPLFERSRNDPTRPKIVIETSFLSDKTRIMKLTSSTLAFIGCCAVSMLFTGCGSLMCGPDQKVNLESQPTGAEVSVYDARGDIVFQKTTPCIAKLPRRQPHLVQAAQYVVLVKKEGFTPVQFPLTGVVNRAYFANILNAGIGYAVDPMTGGMWTLVSENTDGKVINEAEGFFRDERLLVTLPDESLGEPAPVALKAAQN